MRAQRRAPLALDHPEESQRPEESKDQMTLLLTGGNESQGERQVGWPAAIGLRRRGRSES